MLKKLAASDDLVFAGHFPYPSIGHVKILNVRYWRKADLNAFDPKRTFGPHRSLGSSRC